MLVKLLSDLHIEAAPFKYVDHGEQVLVLAGDIGEGERGLAWAWQNVPDHIRVLYVPGNHCYYSNDYTKLNAKFRKWNRANNHITVLLNDVYTSDNWDVEFVGSTLWTDFDLYGNQLLHAMAWKRGLNDSLYILNNDKRIQAHDFIRWNKNSMKFLKKVTDTPTHKTRVLITHYCAELSVAHQYKGDACTPGFATKIPQEIHEKFKFHFHGHTHSSMDYQMPYGTIVKCNPRGYGYENVGGFNDEMVLDI